MFLCTHNSARSQMAEGPLRHLAGDRFEVYSAGTEASFLRPEAASVMAELGVDISAQESETLDRYLNQPFYRVVTVCDDADEGVRGLPRREEPPALVHKGPIAGHRQRRGAASGYSGRCTGRDTGSL